MSDSITRRRDAVRYNEVLAEAAEGLLSELTDPEIIKWVTGVARQHRFHEKRHRNALRKLEDKQEKGGQEPAIAEQQEAFAAEQTKIEQEAQA